MKKQRKVPPALKFLSKDIDFFQGILLREQEIKNEIAKMFLEKTQKLADKILEKVGSVNPELKAFLQTKACIDPDVYLPLINALIISEIKDFQDDDKSIISRIFSFEIEKDSKKDDITIDTYCREINQIVEGYLYLSYVGRYSPDNLDKIGVRIQCKIYLDKTFHG